MSKREDIDQLRHDYFMLSRRVETLEQRVTELMTTVERAKPYARPNGDLVGVSTSRVVTKTATVAPGTRDRDSENFRQHYQDRCDD